MVFELLRSTVKLANKDIVQLSSIAHLLDSELLALLGELELFTVIEYQVQLNGRTSAGGASCIHNYWEVIDQLDAHKLP